MSNQLFAIYHFVEEITFDKYRLKREEKKKELICISSKEVCEEKLKGYENKIEVKGNVVVADYWYCNPVNIEETDPNVLRRSEAFEKMTSKWDPLDVFGFGKSHESVEESLSEAIRQKKGLFG